ARGPAAAGLTRLSQALSRSLAQCSGPVSGPHGEGWQPLTDKGWLIRALREGGWRLALGRDLPFVRGVDSNFLAHFGRKPNRVLGLLITAPALITRPKQPCWVRSFRSWLNSFSRVSAPVR